MTHCLFTFSSYHFAKKTERLLQTFHIPFQLCPVPPSIHPSCGLCVQVNQDDEARVQELLVAHHISHSGIYHLPDS